jgi:hypothetical protein
MPPDALEREQALEKARWIAARFKAHPTANYLYGTVMALEGDIADALQEEAATARARGLAEMDAGMEYRDRMIVFLSQ